MSINEIYCTVCEDYKSEDDFTITSIKNSTYICMDCEREYKALRGLNTRYANISRKGKQHNRKCLKCGTEFKTYAANRICTPCKSENALLDVEEYSIILKG